ncbi:MAG TPA: hypothetical protein PLN61_10635 [bacterium]|nr:hypothetical protein [bacterium]HQI49105.1 hypothetical protein [bacterium]HQJ65819.1 hypothetical protein [bacterium]
MISRTSRSLAAAWLLLMGLAASAGGGKPADPWETLAAAFSGKRGQVEVGGPFAGAEFHDSRPLPARISFYYPVANSIDLSTDYWRRGESRPLRFALTHDGRTDSLGAAPWAYRYTPYAIEFQQHNPDYRCTIRYRFCRTLPVLVLQLELTSNMDQARSFELVGTLQWILRTCQTYAWMRPARVACTLQDPTDTASGCSLAAAAYDAPETDSALVFIANAGALPAARSSRETLELHYRRVLQPGEAWSIILLLGSCRQSEAETVATRAVRDWRNEVTAYEAETGRYGTASPLLEMPDADLMQTAQWSRAVMAANRHYLDGRIVPMPCPAEYNFFFTHDLLLTDLGAVYFDCERVRNDLLYVQSLAKADSILPHAFYWRDTGFQTEFCSTDNWNHLWFILLTASYLRHSGDAFTVQRLAPMLEKSLRMMLENRGDDDLMYAWQPDWWDIGHSRGARAYITILTIRALREYAFMGGELGWPEAGLACGLELADRLRQRLGERLWDEQAGFLFNGLAGGATDRHYYAGSLLAAAWRLLDEERSARLMRTAATELLDRRLGIRIAAPMDFDQYNALYEFLPGEVGARGLYLNGGVWPHGIVWYALGWLAAAQPDSAREVLRHYLTLEGIGRSPLGQPAFFEYRNADPASPRYGEIDKPTFLWTGGWFLHALYQLAGMRENEWNLAFNPRLPQGWQKLRYEVMLNGRKVEVAWRGDGAWFRRIRADGQPLHTAVIPSAASVSPRRQLLLERGQPLLPYLAAATCVVTSARLDSRQRRLRIGVRGQAGQKAELAVVSPWEPLREAGAGLEGTVVRHGEVREIVLHAVLQQGEQEISLRFKGGRE